MVLVLTVTTNELTESPISPSLWGNFIETCPDDPVPGNQLGATALWRRLRNSIKNTQPDFTRMRPR